MKIGDFLADNDKLSFGHGVPKKTPEKGDIWKLELDETNGITPKNGYDKREKFFVVLGVLSDGTVFGGVVFNSNVNLNLPQNIQDLHYPIRKKKYPFLTHNSFINCSRLKTAPITKFVGNRFYGSLKEEDLYLAVQTLKSSPVENPANLARFGL